VLRGALRPSDEPVKEKSHGFSDLAK
jgi:hypothetical protein